LHYYLFNRFILLTQPFMTIENYFERRVGPSQQSNAKATATTTTSSNNIIDEDQLARTFQEIVNCINLDDDSEDDKILSKIGISSGSAPSSSSSSFSRSNLHHVHHSLLPEFESIFGAGRVAFNVAVGTEKGDKSSSNSGICSYDGELGKSFLDDDWHPKSTTTGSNNNSTTGGSGSNNSTSSTSNTTSKLAPPGLKPDSNGLVSRPVTPSSRAEYFNNHRLQQQALHSPSSTSVSSGGIFNNSPPSDYVCKLCNFEGHWLKDCRLYEPRTPASSVSSFKSFSSTSSNGGNGSGSSSVVNRTLLPPGNYVCRLCNVSGHWIDECVKFQPKSLSSEVESSSNLSSTPSSSVLPPMLGPGPTPNYRPPAYLSKPVPSNYICNLCNRPGHWIQQCTEFTPIINHKKY
jgi:hypothetical protein